jgi:hypothetical protein
MVRARHNGKQYGRPHNEAVVRVLVDGRQPMSWKCNW